MTLVLPALVLAILVASVINVPGGTQLDLILPMVLLAVVSSILTSAVGRRGVVAAFSVVRERWGPDHSARRSMNRYLQTVLADLGALSLKPYKDQT